jgi:hypothetical protein
VDIGGYPGKRQFDYDALVRWRQKDTEKVIQPIVLYALLFCPLALSLVRK